MTPQEAYDTAARGIIAQNYVASYSAGTGCMYRGPEGRKCALGHLIPDDLYKSSMEGHGPGQLAMHDAAIAELLRGLPLQFLCDLQQAHDNQLHEHGTKAWRDRMYMIAAIHRLNASALYA